MTMIFMNEAGQLHDGGALLSEQAVADVFARIQRGEDVSILYKGERVPGGAQYIHPRSAADLETTVLRFHAVWQRDVADIAEWRDTMQRR